MSHVTSRSALGVVALVLAAIVGISMPITAWLVNLPQFIEQASPISGAFAVIQFALLTIAAVFAVVAIVTRRGRGIAVLALALVGILLIVALVLPALLSLVPGSSSTPVV